MLDFFYFISLIFSGVFHYLAFKLIGVGHELMVSTNTSYIQWFSLAKPTSKVTPTGGNRSLVAHTSKCG